MCKKCSKCLKNITNTEANYLVREIIVTYKYKKCCKKMLFHLFKKYKIYECIVASTYESVSYDYRCCTYDKYLNHINSKFILYGNTICIDAELNPNKVSKKELTLIISKWVEYVYRRIYMESVSMVKLYGTEHITRVLFKYKDYIDLHRLYKMLLKYKIMYDVNWKIIHDFFIRNKVDIRLYTTLMLRYSIAKGIFNQDKFNDLDLTQYFSEKDIELANIYSSEEDYVKFMLLANHYYFNTQCCLIEHKTYNKDCYEQLKCKIPIDLMSRGCYNYGYYERLTQKIGDSCETQPYYTEMLNLPIIKTFKLHTFKTTYNVNDNADKIIKNNVHLSIAYYGKDHLNYQNMNITVEQFCNKLCENKYTFLFSSKIVMSLTEIYDEDIYFSSTNYVSYILEKYMK